MMKSIAFNDSTHPADEEGFVIVDTPMEFEDSVLEEDEESYDHCDDAFSFSSLHQTLPVSSLPIEAVQDNFFEPPDGQEVLPPAVSSSPSLLSDGDDGDDADDGRPATTFASEDCSAMKVVISHIDPDVEGLCALVSSIPSVPPEEEIFSGKDEENSTSREDSPESIPAIAQNVEATEDNDIPAGTSGDILTDVSGEDKEEGPGGSTTPSSSSSSAGPGTSTDEDDEVGSTGTDKAFDAMENPPVGRMSKKKRRKQLKLARKAAAAAAAAAALGQMSLPAPKRRGKNRKKVANIAVSCAVQSIAEYKEHVERTKVSKKIR